MLCWQISMQPFKDWAVLFLLRRIGAALRMQSGCRLAVPTNARMPMKYDSTFLQNAQNVDRVSVDAARCVFMDMSCLVAFTNISKSNLRCACVGCKTKLLGCSTLLLDCLFPPVHSHLSSMQMLGNTLTCFLRSEHLPSSST